MQTRLKRAARVALAATIAVLTAACGEDDVSPPWRMVLENQPGALVALWGSSARDLWIAGTDARDGTGPLIFHWDGKNLARTLTGVAGDLFWIGGGAGPSVWAVGKATDRALILRYQPSTGQFERMASNSQATLYGVFPLSETDVWAVGERPDGSGEALRLVNGAFEPATDLPAGAGAAAFFKVWGRGEQDLWIVGRGGNALHRTTAGWQTVALPANRPLFTIHGNHNTTVAVGGQQSALVVEDRGGVLADVTPPGAPQLNGVFVSGDGRVTAAGIDGTLWQRGAASSAPWLPLTGPSIRLDYHAVFTDPDGGIWAAGGQITVPPFSMGLLVHKDVTR